MENKKVKISGWIYNQSLEDKLWAKYLDKYDAIYGGRDDKLFAEGKLKENKITRLKKTELWTELQERLDKLYKIYQRRRIRIFKERERS